MYINDLVPGPSVSRSDSMTPPPTTAATSAVTAAGVQSASVTDYERLFAESESEEEDDEDEEDHEAPPADLPVAAADGESRGMPIPKKQELSTAFT